MHFVGRQLIGKQWPQPRFPPPSRLRVGALGRSPGPAALRVPSLHILHRVRACQIRNPLNPPGGIPLLDGNPPRLPVSNPTHMKITVETTVTAPIEEVWRAWTTPADI